MEGQNSISHNGRKIAMTTIKIPNNTFVYIPKYNNGGKLAELNDTEGLVCTVGELVRRKFLPGTSPPSPPPPHTHTGPSRPFSLPILGGIGSIDAKYSMEQQRVVIHYWSEDKYSCVVVKFVHGFSEGEWDQQSNSWGAHLLRNINRQ
jgi:hypothetical protein